MPVLPAAAKEFSRAGLEAYTRYWYSTLSYAYETGNIAPLMAVTNASCARCMEVAQSVQSTYAKGGWVTGGVLTVSSSHGTFETTPFGTYEARVIVRQQQVTDYRSNGSVKDTQAQAPSLVDRFMASYENHKWTTQNISVATDNE